jgi:hypothetical protein
MALLSNSEGLAGYAGSYTLGNNDILVELINGKFQFSTLGARSYVMPLMHLLLFRIRMCNPAWGEDDI